MLVKILFVKVPTFRLKLQPSSGESDKEFVEKVRSYTMQIGKSELIMLSLWAKFKNSCGKCIPPSRFRGFLQVLISHASKIRLLRQFVLVRKGWFPYHCRRSQTIADRKSQIADDRKESCFHIIADNRKRSHSRLLHTFRTAELSKLHACCAGGKSQQTIWRTSRRKFCCKQIYFFF